MQKRVASADRLLSELQSSGKLKIRPVVSQAKSKTRHNPYAVGLKRYELVGGVLCTEKWNKPLPRKGVNGWTVPDDPVEETAAVAPKIIIKPPPNRKQSDVAAVRMIYQNLGESNSSSQIKTEPVDPDDVAGTSLEPEVNIEIKEEILDEVPPSEIPSDLVVSDLYGEGFASTLDDNINEFII